MRAWPWAVGVVTAGAAVVSLSCRQVAGISDSPPMALVSSTPGGLSWGTSACASCIESSCSAPATTCAGDPACKPFFDCFYTCKFDDWTCRAQCWNDHPIRGAVAFPGLTTCASTHCASECGLTCGILGADTVPDAAAACESCYENDSRFCKNVRDCTSSAECIGFMQCLNSCTTPDCTTNCANEFGLDGGVTGTASSLGAIPSELATAIGTSAGPGPCYSPCAIGANWSCMGRDAWPNPTLGGTTLETQVLDSTSDMGVAGVAVSLCRFGDPDCRRPLNPDAATSDANGFVKVVVPPAATTIDTVGTSTFAQFSLPSIFPTLVFIGYPVSEPLAPIAVPYVLVVSRSNPPAGWDTSLAIINAVALDCVGGLAPNVKIAMDSVDAGAIPYCFEDAQTVTTGLTETTANGAPYGCGMVNVPPGTVTVTATPTALGKPSSRLQVLAQAGTLTTVFLYPMPSLPP